MSLKTYRSEIGYAKRERRHSHRRKPRGPYSAVRRAFRRADRRAAREEIRRIGMA